MELNVFAEALFWTAMFSVVLTVNGRGCIFKDNIETSSANTIIGLPLLFQYEDCSQSSQLYRYTTLYFTNYFAQNTSVDYHVVSDGATRFCDTEDQYIYKDVHSYKLPLSNPRYCIRGVNASVVKFISDSSVSTTAISLTQQGVTAFSMFPEKEVNVNATHPYEYYLIYGVAKQKEGTAEQAGAMLARLPETSFKIYPATEIDYVLDKHSSFKTTADAQEYEGLSSLCGSLWMKPRTKPFSNQTFSLSGTKVIANNSVSVYTGKAKITLRSTFSTEGFVTHQMPPVDQWGTTYVADLSPIKLYNNKGKENVIATFSIISVNATNVTFHYHNNTVSIVVKEFNLTPQRETHVPVLQAQSEVQSFTHVLIESEEPILVLMEIHSETKEVYSSILLQSVQWFSKQQTIVLAHPSELKNTRYYATVIVPKQFYDTSEIQVSDTDSGLRSTLSEYEYFDSNDVITGRAYVLVHLKPQLQNGSESKTILIQHTNACAKVGVTLHAIGSQTSYSYGGGYIATDGVDCTASDLLYILIVSVIVAVLLLSTLPSLSLLLLCRCTPDTGEYQFDVFLSFAEHDHDFVERYLYLPLKEEGYKVFWHLTDFIPGLSIQDNMIRAIKTSRAIVFFCTEHFADSNFCAQELDFCVREKRNNKRLRRVIPVVIGEENCPTELRRLNQVRPRRNYFDEDEAMRIVKRLKLGKPSACSGSKENVSKHSHIHVCVQDCMQVCIVGKSEPHP